MQLRGNNGRSTHQSWHLMLIPIELVFDDSTIFEQIQIQIQIHIQIQIQTQIHIQIQLQVQI